LVEIKHFSLLIFSIIELGILTNLCSKICVRIYIKLISMVPKITYNAFGKVFYVQRCDKEERVTLDGKINFTLSRV
jgi:hypothetical protein